MRHDALDRVAQATPGTARRDELLAPFTAYKVGGPADLLVEPNTMDEFCAVVAAAHDEELPLFMLGAGTNLIIRDGGIRGVVVHLGRGFREVRTEGTDVVSGASASMARAALAAERAALTGLEFGFDIPGTVGGALRMNAGCHGTEVKDILREVRGCDASGAPRTFTVAELEFEYRRTIYPLEFLVGEVVFALAPGDPEAVEARRREYHAWRLRTQPKGRSCGSVFKNPPGDHAGRLIEAAGLKGARVGGAVVSEKHANFIMNDDRASAADIEALIRRVQDRVREQFSVSLELEVRIVGEPETVGGRQG